MPLNIMVQLLLPVQEVLKDMIIADKEMCKTERSLQTAMRLTLFPAHQLLATGSSHVLG